MFWWPSTRKFIAALSMNAGLVLLSVIAELPASFVDMDCFGVR